MSLKVLIDMNLSPEWAAELRDGSAFKAPHAPSRLRQTVFDTLLYSHGEAASWRRSMTEKTSGNLASRIESRIILLRGQKVMLDFELGDLYEVETRALVQAVKRNLNRFPEDFMFQLTSEETTALRSQSVISKPEGRGGRRYAPYAFTEQGVAMLSSVLRSDRAVAVNVEIMRAFVRLRRLIASHEELAEKLARLEAKYDAKFQDVFTAIRELMLPNDSKSRRRIGFVNPADD